MAAFVFISAPAEADEPKKDSLAGKWNVVEQPAISTGKGQPTDSIKLESVVFSGDNLTFSYTAQNKQSSVKTKFVTNATVTPAQIDFQTQDNQKYIGIYLINGNELQLCYNEDGPTKKRPTGFINREGLFYVLKRD
jgi:uncharacterized protein (TIGR03067 family)